MMRKIFILSIIVCCSWGCGDTSTNTPTPSSGAFSFLPQASNTPLNYISTTVHKSELFDQKLEATETHTVLSRTGNATDSTITLQVQSMAGSNYTFSYTANATSLVRTIPDAAETWQVLQFPLQQGRTFSIIPNEQPGMNSTATIQSTNENVTVPLGTFSTVKVSYSYNESDADFSYQHSAIFYFAQNQGLIKSIRSLEVTSKQSGKTTSNVTTLERR